MINQNITLVQPYGAVPAKIMIVGECASESDIVRQRVFTGSYESQVMQILAQSGIQVSECFFTTVLRRTVMMNDTSRFFPKTKGYDPAKYLVQHGRAVAKEALVDVELLREEILRVKPNVILALGNLSMFVLTGEYGVDNWRSSIMDCALLPGFKVIPTFSGMRVCRQQELKRIMSHDFRRAKAQSAFPEIRRKPYNFEIRPTFEQAKTRLQWLLSEVESGNIKDIGNDIETRAGHIACVALAWSDTDAVCIPFMERGTESYWKSVDEEAELAYLIYLICRKARVIGQNFNYDAQYFHKFHLWKPNKIFDTMLAQHVCFNVLPKNLAFLSSMYLDDHYYWKDDRSDWKDSEGEETFWKYNCTDACRTLAIAKVLENVVKSLGMSDVNAFQQKLQGRVLDTMLRGVKVDLKVRANFRQELEAEVEKRTKILHELVGYPLNVGSSKQMCQLLYEQFALKPVLGKTGSPSADDEALNKIKEKAPHLKPLLDIISQIRSMNVFLKTNLSAELDEDLRMRSSFDVAGTDTYRFASRKNAFNRGMNMQNVSKGGKPTEVPETASVFQKLAAYSLPNLRKMFIPDEGKTIADTDLDSADLRIVTWESNCEWMKDHFRNGRKPYVEVMKEYFRDQTKNKNSKEYGMFKSLCHGTNYLGTAKGMAPRLGLLVHEVERIQKWYFGLCPEIKKWHTEIEKQVRGRGFVQNAFGYRHYVFKRIEGTVLNEVVAWIPQSTVACLINRAYDRIETELAGKVEVLIQVHDSLVSQFDTSEAGILIPKIQECCTVPIPYKEPLIIPVGLVTSEVSWGDCG